MTISPDDVDLYTYLDTNYVLFDDWGCLVALSDDRDEIFLCPLYDNGPDRDGDHLNWGLVTAPEPGFLDKVNKVFGTTFRFENFAGR